MSESSSLRSKEVDNGKDDDKPSPVYTLLRVRSIEFVSFLTDCENLNPWQFELEEARGKFPVTARGIAVSRVLLSVRKNGPDIAFL